MNKCYLRDFVNMVKFFLHLCGTEESMGTVVLVLEARKAKHSQVRATLKPNTSFHSICLTLPVVFFLNVSVHVCVCIMPKTSHLTSNQYLDYDY